MQSERNTKERPVNSQKRGQDARVMLVERQTKRKYRENTPNIVQEGRNVNARQTERKEKEVESGLIQGKNNDQREQTKSRGSGRKNQI